MPLDLYVDVGEKKVPNQFPRKEADYRIAIVGEAPGTDEENVGIPFVGKSGNLLDNVLHASSIDRNACFVGNVCQVRPPGNKIKLFKWEGEQIQSGLAQLGADLAEYKPNICVLLGNTPLHSAKNRSHKIGDWRGSLFKCTNPESPFFGYKCIATYHPAFIIQPNGYPMRPLMSLDLDRAREDGYSTELYLPQRSFELDLTPDEIIFRLDHWPQDQRMSVDIEGVLGCWTMVSISSDPSHGFVIRWGSMTLEEEARVLRSFSRAMWDIDIPKTFQNCLYDLFVMLFGHRILVRNVNDDTMVKSWEIYPELPKGLEFQASMWTKEPNWKQRHAYSKAEQKRRAKEGIIEDPRNTLRHCCLDSAVTEEIALAQDSALTGPQRDHYNFNMTLLRPLLYMEMTGHAYDIEGAAQMLGETKVSIQEYKTRLLLRAGGRDLFGKKGSFSTQKLADFLYTVKGFPTQYKKEHGKLTEKVTTNTAAILTLGKKFDDPLLSEILKIKKDLKIQQYLEVKTDTDGRVRCGYNIVGTETGRLSCYESPTGSGTNLTTITKKLRRLYRADPGYDYFQCDLAGADGWTVSAHCARLGDNTMLEDYYAGIKPAAVIALMYLHGPSAGQEQRHILKERCDEFIYQTKQPKCSFAWTYFACKRVYHGTNYGLGEGTMQDQIMEDSYKESGIPIFVLTADIRKLKDLYLNGRYKGVNRWHQWAENELVTVGALTDASGHVRQFLGKKKDHNQVYHATLREFLAHEPQANTTYATNRAMFNLWMDPENRGETTGVIVQPLHQVHDALNGQWPQVVRDWAKEKVRSWFSNELTIAGIKLTIPFEGGYGPSWGEAKTPI